MITYKPQHKECNRHDLSALNQETVYTAETNPLHCHQVLVEHVDYCVKRYRQARYTYTWSFECMNEGCLLYFLEGRYVFFSDEDTCEELKIICRAELC